MINTVILECRLTIDPELKDVNGNKKARLRVASNRVFKNSNGERVERPLFIDVECWGGLAEVCYNYLKKGRRVLVEGRLENDSWVANDGTKRNKTYITAEKIHFLDRANTNINTSTSTDVKVDYDVEEEVPF